MKFLTFAVLLGLSLPAHAVGFVGPCTSTEAPPPKPAASAPFAMPQGYKYGLSTCTLPIAGWSTGGMVAGWICRDKDKIYTEVYAVRHSAITQEMTTSFLAIPFANDPREATRIHFSKYGTQHFLGMADVWCETAGTDWRTRWNDALQIKVDEVKAYATAPQWLTSGGAVYRVTNGVRSTIAGRTIAAGLACDCTNPIVYMGFNFCPLASGPVSEVMLCKKQP
jgi:hypothetical protein